MNTKLIHTLLAVTLLLLQGGAVAEDIDLFVRASPSSTAPNVLFVIDNAANFSSTASPAFDCTIDGKPNSLAGTVGGIEQCALYQVISELDPDTVNIGIMVYNAANVVDHLDVECSKIVASRPGGCLVYPITPMTAAKKVELLTFIKNWTTNDKDKDPARRYVKANSQATGGAMQEAWAYLKGKTGLSGKDYADATPPTVCNTYIIFLGNSYSSSGSPGDQTGSSGPKDALEGTNPVAGKRADPGATPDQKALITRTFATSCGSATLGTSSHENKGYYADEWARYLNAHDVTTYTIGVLGDRCQADYAATLTSMAEYGGGKYFPTRNFDELVVALQTALSEMLSVNSVFASVSLPISVNTEGTYLNQVYIGMFRPDKKQLPRWAGNLKQYRLGRIDGTLRLLDAKPTPDPAISSAGTGFLSACARSYWTPPTDDTYWALFEERNCGASPAVSNREDGNVVEKGAQGYKVRGSAVASRNLKTCDGSCGKTLVNFETGATAISKAALGNGAMSDTARTDLITWARGLNNKADDETFVASTAVRPSVHGDVVHSRPVAVNFAEKVVVDEDETPPPDEPKVVVFYGGNDGVLRAVNGNRTESIGSVPAGSELWGFVPPEFYSKISVLRENGQRITVRREDGPDGDIAKPYGFDGAITSYRSGSDVWIYATMRRGGRMVYAFNVSKITDPSDADHEPTLEWRLGCDAAGTCTTDATGIGQTWSSPKVIKTAGYVTGTVHDPMLIMGGGYDPCEDADVATCDSSANGRKVYVIDAKTGTILKTFDTERPVVADVFVVSDSAGLAKYAYAVDAGGNIYRISGATANTPFSSTAPGSWTITRIASVGCDSVADCRVAATVDDPGVANRKFLFSVDAVEEVPASGVYYLLVGSGDREKPLKYWKEALATENHFFAIKDAPTVPTWLTAEFGTCGANLICLNSLYKIPSSGEPDPTILASKKGWYLELGAGEQAVTSAITVFGSTTFSSHTPTDPPDGACTSDLGTARVYNVRYFNAAPSKPGATNRSEVIAGGGLPPSPVAGIVRLDDGTEVPFVIGSNPLSPLEGGEPVSPSLTTLPKSTTYWFIRK